MRFFSFFFPLIIFALAACQSPPPEPGMKLGKPYMVDGHLYYPEYDPDYDETGEASWYGPGFHGKSTASGEVFNQNDLTAAHPTLPMPSLVRVTNLQNGKSLIVRVNDRGPFKSHRIIDLSKAAAHRLGITSVAQVRVQFLSKETEEYLASVKSGGRRVINMAQYNNDAEAAAPSSQIVENIDSSSHAGQVIDEAAPVMTVGAADLDAPAKPAHAVGLIKPAMADDAVPSNAPFVPARAITSGDSYIIQAGSFGSEENARKLAARLVGVASLAIDKVGMGEKSLWRVRLGPFRNQQMANEALVRLRANGVPDAQIIHL